MISEVCHEIRNWFDRGLPKYYGEFEIANGSLVLKPNMEIQDGQYFRIMGSVFNNGVHCYPVSNLRDEKFKGSVWCMALPKELVALCDEISQWQETYGGVGSQAMSPFSSESFGGYSYTKGSRSSSSGSVSDYPSWQTAFSSRLNKWRKI